MRLLRGHDFRSFWLGQSISLLGDQISYIALPLVAVLVLVEVALGVLAHAAPAMNPRASAYLLAALAPSIKGEASFVCVVDPGVGTERRALALRADGRWFVGPDNGLLDVVGRRAQAAEWWEITWRPEQLSATFHGRDLFAPVAAKLARGEAPPGRRWRPPWTWSSRTWRRTRPWSSR